MGQTYVSGYCAGAFRTTSGYAYVLFNETCESNVFPQRPHWSAHLMDYLPGMAGRIVEHAYCCDDGMTRGPRGRHIRAEHYVEQSEQALRSAHLLTGTLTLTFDGNMDSIPVDLIGAFDDMARQFGVTLDSVDIEAQSALRHRRTLDLDNGVHGDLLMRFALAHAGVAYPWRIFKRLPPQVPLDDGAPWQPVQLPPDACRAESHKTTAYLDQFRLFKLSQHNHELSWTSTFTAVVSSTGQLIGFDPLEWFCRNYLKERNSQVFGASRPALAALRKWAGDIEGSHDVAALQFHAVLEGTGHSAHVLDQARVLANGGDPSKPFNVQNVVSVWELKHLVRAGLNVTFPQLSGARQVTADLF